MHNKEGAIYYAQKAAELNPDFKQASEDFIKIIENEEWDKISDQFMKQLISKQGKVVVEEVPAPACGAGQILVENLFSLISPGTELSSSNYSTKLAKDIKLVKEHGFSAYKIITGMLQAGVTPGYSCCGRVMKVGKDVVDIKKDDIVACAGANIASHAEFIAVPRNLAVKVPDGVSFEDACSATVGAIALQLSLIHI